MEKLADGADFIREANQFRRELLAYCYRMLGSAHDAEDLVQETYLRAWRSYSEFEGRASLRTWLYRIATNACLTAIERRGRRPLPSGLGGPADIPELPQARHDLPWLEPIPDAMYVSKPNDPATVTTTRASVRLALVAAWQHLPARQRAVLLLCDVLSWRAAEVADLLDTSPDAVNSMLRRARAQLERMAPEEDEIAEPGDPGQRELLDRYAKAFENADVDALLALLTEDASWEMPPNPAWFSGRDGIGRLLRARLPGKPGACRLVPVMANGQPAFGFYLSRDDGPHRALGIQVLTLTSEGISRVVSFHDASLFPVFDLPEVWSSGTQQAVMRLSLIARPRGAATG